MVNKQEGMEIDEKDIVNIGLIVKERRRYMYMNQSIMIIGLWLTNEKEWR